MFFACGKCCRLPPKEINQNAPPNASVPLVLLFRSSGILAKEPGTNPAPMAYINFISVDRNFVPQTDISLTNFVRITEAAKESGANGGNGLHERLYAEVTVKQAGYMYIYLSNDNLTVAEVYFDDFKVTQIKSPVIQTDDYYPFGLTFNSYSRENSVENRYLYNQGTGEKTFKTERLNDLGLNVDQSKYRTYDYITGRWWQVDPKADEGDLVSLTPYNYSHNKPIRYNDPEGDNCIPCVTALVGAIAGVGIAAYNGGIASDVVKAGLARGVSGFIIGTGAGLLATSTVGATGLISVAFGAVVSNTIVGIVAGGAEETTKQALSDKPMNTATIVKAAAVGGAVSALAEPLGNVVAGSPPWFVSFRDRSCPHEPQIRNSG